MQLFSPCLGPPLRGFFRVPVVLLSRRGLQGYASSSPLLSPDPKGTALPQIHDIPPLELHGSVPIAPQAMHTNVADESDACGLNKSDATELATTEGRWIGAMDLEAVLDKTSPEAVEAVFRSSVAARTVGNAVLRRYLERLPPRHYARGVAAVRGAEAAGLRLAAGTCEAFLGLLLRAGQLREGLALHQAMQRRALPPTPHACALLMELCLQRGLPREAQVLFRDLQRRGVRPSSENYELMLLALAMETPPQWELAIKLFDKLARERNTPRITAKTYNALMTVYMNMEPFDWRVVYNCYHEMRSRTPRIPLEWESYLILREALVRGKTGFMRRSMAFFDAWVATTELGSWDFFKGLLVYFAVMWVIKSFLGYLFIKYVESTTMSDTLIGESVLPP